MNRTSPVALAIALALAAPLAPTPVLAQGRSVQQEWEAPRITGFDVEQVQQLTPGTPLAFTVWGTPGLGGRLQIAGAQRSVLLEEVVRGQYQAWYTIGSADRITPASRVTVNLRDGTRVATATLDENLVQGWQPHQAAAPAPQIEAFDVRYETPQRQAMQLVFFVRGTPGADVTVRMRGGSQRRIVLTESVQRPGEYSGAVTLARDDRIAPDQPVVAHLRSGERSVTAALAGGLDAQRLGSWVRTGTAVACSNCATVVAITPVEVRGEGGYVGPLAGGVLGAVIGNQVGDGSGQKAATIVGAIGGALLGREVERRRRAETHYDVALRMADGTQRSISVPQVGELRVGDPVKIGADNTITLDSSRPRPRV